MSEARRGAARAQVVVARQSGEWRVALITFQWWIIELPQHSVLLKSTLANLHYYFFWDNAELQNFPSQPCLLSIASILSPGYWTTLEVHWLTRRVFPFFFTVTFKNLWKCPVLFIMFVFLWYTFRSSQWNTAWRRTVNTDRDSVSFSL